MNTKKFLGLALASTLALSMTAPAFAAPTSGGTSTPTPTPTPSTSSGLDENGSMSFSYSGETWTEADLALDIVVPTTTSSKIILNPYGLTYLDETDRAATNKVITGGYNYIENLSNFEVAVDFSVAGTANGDVTFATAAPKTATTKQAFLPVRISAVKNRRTEPAEAKIGTAKVIVSGETQTSDPAKPIILDRKNGRTTKQDASNSNATYSNARYDTASATSAATDSACPFLGFGIKVNDPTIINITPAEKLADDAKWTADDTVAVDMIFTFSKATVTLGNGIDATL